MNDKTKSSFKLKSKKRNPLFCVDCAHCTVKDKSPIFVSDYCTLKRLYLTGIRGYAETCNYYTPSIKDASEEIKKATLEYMEKNKPAFEPVPNIKSIADTFADKIGKMFIMELRALGIEASLTTSIGISQLEKELNDRKIGLYQDLTPNNAEYYGEDLRNGKILFKWRLETFIDPLDNKITQVFNKII